MPTRRIIRRRDLAPPNFDSALSTASLALARTDPGHIAMQMNSDSQFATDGTARYEIRPRGNSVTHEDEMMKVASNQMDYEAATSLYTPQSGADQNGDRQITRRGDA